jgi:hypothetical protein
LKGGGYLTERLLLLVEEDGNIRMATLDTGMDLEIIAKDEGLKRVVADRGDLDGQIIGDLEKYNYNFEEERIVKKDNV